MSDFLGYAFLSIPLIGAFAMFALGISAIYRASRVLNLAHGAMAMIPAYVNYTLVEKVGLPMIIALPVAVLAGAVLGVLVERLFVRRLRPQGPTAQTVGTVAVTGLLVAFAAKIWGTGSILAPQVFPSGDVSLLGSRVGYGSLGLLAVGIVASGGMYAFFRLTEYGLAMRGAAQNRVAAALMGVDPDRAAAAAWAIGGGLAALAGILLAAVTSLDPYTLSLQVLPAFVAALLGGLESLVGAMVGATIVGLVFGMVPAFGEAPLIGGLMRSAGAPQLVLTVTALIVMVVRGRRITSSEDAGEAFAGGQAFHRLEPSRYTRRIVVAAVLLSVVPWVAPYSVLGSALLAMQYALVAISLVLLIGWIGQISLAHATFVGLGAFVTALVARNLGLGFPANLVFGAVAGAAAALALGAVALRVRGLYLAVATLIFAWMGDAFLFRAKFLGVAGGSSNIPNQFIGTPGGFPAFDLTSRTVLYFVFLAVLANVLIASSNLRDTRIGRAFFAVRGSEMAAASLGIDVMKTKMVAFALSGMLAGIAGTLVIVSQRTVVADQFLFTVSLQYLAIAVVGGLTSVGGAVAAGLVFAALNELFFRVDALAGWLEVVSAGLLAVVLLVYPGGLAAIPSAIRRVVDPGGAGTGPLVRLAVAVRRRLVGATSRLATMAMRLISAPIAYLRPRPRDGERLSVDAPARREVTSGFDWMVVPAAAGNAQAGTISTPFAGRPQPKYVGRDGARKRAGSVDSADAVLRAGHRDATPLLPRSQRTALVEASGITVRFGGLTAVSDASLTVYEDEIVGLIGPNGAGKTTLFNAILGLNDPAEGIVRIHGEDVGRKGPHERARLGVARTFQVVQLFNELNVSDNLLVATHMHNHSGLLSNIAAGPRTLAAEIDSRKRVDRIIELLNLEDVRDAQVTDLPFGVLRMVEMGRALVTGAPVLMLDEAASGLNDAETDRLISVVRDVRDLGVSVLLIEHDIRMVTGVSDYMYCLDRGKLIAEGTPDEVKRHPDVVTAYLGASEEDEEAAHAGAEVDA